VFRNVIIDCQDLERQAAFWTAASGFERRSKSGVYLTLVDPAQPRPFIVLQQAPEGKQGKNRLHLDFGAADMKAEVARLVGLGARELQTLEDPETFTVMQDPEGNEFCIVQERQR
jgi:predicted enzyme related to lactoylglutathione lyase